MSSSIVPEYEAANEQYAAAFNKGDLALPPSRYDIGVLNFLHS